MNKPNDKNIVFLSHSSKDKKHLVEFKKALEEKTNGTIEFFLSSDGQSIPLGRNWVASVEHSLDGAKLAFLFLTANSIDSTWVAFEAGFMHAKNIRVIPVGLPGIELGQVPPPIGLLQGFNMHSYEAMNNFFEILNKEFGHQHKPTFSQDDFRKIFGVDSELGSGFFGEYSALVRGIAFEGRILQQPPLIPTLEAELKNLEISLTKTENKDERDNKYHNLDAAGPGIRVTIDLIQNRYTMVIHSEMLSLLLPIACSVISKSCNFPFNATVNFIAGVDACGTDVHVSARAYGTEFTVQPYGRMSFRKITINGANNPSTWESSEPLKLEDIRELVVGLFDSGMLELKPVKQIDPVVASLANTVMRMKRRY
jgi:hypothetical protein